MGYLIFEDQTFRDTNCIEAGQKITFEVCEFIDSSFAALHLSSVQFNDCTMKDCDFTMANFNKSALRNVQFIACRMLGVNFSEVNPINLALRFESCNLSNSFLNDIKLRNTIFKDCILHYTDFSGSDLTSSIFEHCDMSGAIFENCNLEDTDFSSARNYNLDPDKNKLKNARFSTNGLKGLLHKYGVVIVD